MITVGIRIDCTDGETARRMMQLLPLTDDVLSDHGVQAVQLIWESQPSQKRGA